MQTFVVQWHEDRSRKVPVQAFVHRPTDPLGADARYVPFPLDLVPMPLRRAVGLRPTADLHLFGTHDPYGRNKVFLLGADGHGRYIFGQLLFGARVSLTLGVVAMLLTVPVGALFGALAGAFGGLVDTGVMALSDALAAVPGLYWVMLLNSVLLLLIVRGAVDADSTTRYLYLAVSMAAVGWGTVARGTRAAVRVAKERTFSLAAAALGATRTRVTLRHLLPQAASYLIDAASVMVPNAILLEATLSFFGVGIRAPSTSWGP